MRADIRTLVALDTVLFNPFGNKCRNTAFFICGCTGRKCAVRQRIKSADGKTVPFAFSIGLKMFSINLGSCTFSRSSLVDWSNSTGTSFVPENRIPPPLYFFLQCLHLFFRMPPVWNFSDRQVLFPAAESRSDEKCALHNHINAVSQSQTVCQLSRINQIEPCIFSISA